MSADVAALERWVRRFAALVAEQAELLTRLDAAIGDADHGTNLDRGMRAVLADLDAAPATSVADLGRRTGMALVSNVGGAGGPLYGTLFLRLGTSAGDVGELDAGGLAAALRAGVDGVAARGKAQREDKTMLDALLPALDALDAALEARTQLPAALAAAADAAEAGRDATTAMQARKGRASYLGERSVGHTDPGATSSALLVRALARELG